jgi:hypothetical protein
MPLEMTSHINIHLHTNHERNVLESRAFLRCCCHSIADFSKYRENEEVLVAAATGLIMDSVDWISVPKWATSASASLEIPLVKPAYFASWHDQFCHSNVPPLIQRFELSY